jgi:hypothetical protein
LRPGAWFSVTPETRTPAPGAPSGVFISTVWNVTSRAL